MNSVLIVEDNFDLAAHWRQLLENVGVRVVHEDNAESAIDCLKSDPSIAVVITDMVLASSARSAGEHGGLLVLTFVSLNLSPAPKVLAVSGAGASSGFVDAFNLLSPNNVLTKPVQDATLLNRVQELLTESQAEQEQRNRALVLETELRKSQYSLENTSELIFRVGVDGAILYSNSQAARSLGYSRDELKRLMISAVDESTGHAFWQTLANSEPGVVDGRESEFTTKSGATFYVRVTTHLLDFEGDRFFHLTASDITEAKAAAVALENLNADLRRSVSVAEESERRFRSLADSASPLCWTTELDSSCSWLNKRWLDYAGRTLEEQLGEAWIQTVHPDDRERTSSEYLAAFDKQQPFVIAYRLRRHDGAYRWHTVNANPRFDETGRFVGFVGMSFDDHDARESRVALEESEASLRVVVTNLQKTRQRLMAAESSQRAMLNLLGSSDGVWNWKVNTDEAEYAAGFRKLLGFDGDDVEGFPNALESFSERIHPADTTEYWQDVETCLQQQVPFEHEFRIRQKSGLYIWVRSRGSASFDQQGRAEQLVGSTHSIEMQKAAEEAMVEANSELRRVNEDLEQFAYVASHDLQEPLRAISGFVQLLTNKYESQLDPRGRGYIAKVVAGVSRMQQLINDLLHFSRVAIDDSEFTSVNLSDCVAEAQAQLEQTIVESHAVVTVGDLPSIAGVRSQLVQLFQNLLGNAIKYRRADSPTIVIVGRMENDSWVISVQDNGIGIAEEHQDRIFLLFKRLHHREEYPGTGIGLAICKRVVDAHSGSIAVQSTEGEGSCFTVRFPAKPRS